MPLTKDDVKFVLAVMPDVAAMQKSIESIGKQIDKTAVAAGKIMQDKMIQGMSAFAKETSKSVELMEALSVAGREQMSIIQQINAEEAKRAEYHKSMVEMMSAATLPTSWEVGMDKMQKQKAAEANTQAGMVKPASYAEIFTDSLKKGGAKTAMGDVARQFGIDLFAQIDKVKGGGAKGVLNSLLGHVAGGGGLGGGQLLGSILGGGAGGGVGGAVGAGAGGLAAAAGPIGLVVAGATAAIGALAAVGGAIKDFTLNLIDMGIAAARLGSPAAFKQWSMALEDIQGVIGQSFVPILNVMRDSVRLFGDVLATILPNMEEMDEAIAPLKEGFALLANALKEFASENGPLIRTYIVGMFKSLAMVLGATAQSLSWVVRYFNLMLMPLSAILRLFGIGGTSGMRSSVGAAARPAQIQGIEEYQRGLQISAFSQPGNRIDYQERASNTLTDILSVLRTIANPANAVTDAALEGVGRAVEDVTGAAPGTAAGIRHGGNALLRGMSFGLLGG